MQLKGNIQLLRHANICVLDPFNPLITLTRNNKCDVTISELPLPFKRKIEGSDFKRKIFLITFLQRIIRYEYLHTLKRTLVDIAILGLYC